MSQPLRFFRSSIAVAALASLTASAADFPAKPVRLITPFPPGGSVDSLRKDVRDRGRSIRDIFSTTIMGADNPPGMELTTGNNMAVSLSGDDTELLTGYWEKLSDGGMVMMPLEKQMWGDVFGMCTDRFGVSWLVNIAGGDAG